MAGLANRRSPPAHPSVLASTEAPRITLRASFTLSRSWFATPFCALASVAHQNDAEKSGKYAAKNGSAKYSSAGQGVRHCSGTDGRPGSPGGLLRQRVQNRNFYRNRSFQMSATMDGLGRASEAATGAAQNVARRIANSNDPKEIQRLMAEMMKWGNVSGSVKQAMQQLKQAEDTRAV
jgi:hypothetical protein